MDRYTLFIDECCLASIQDHAEMKNLRLTEAIDKLNTLTRELAEAGKRIRNFQLTCKDYEDMIESLELKLAAANAKIEKAPHYWKCKGLKHPIQTDNEHCDCWKSEN